MSITKYTLTSENYDVLVKAAINGLEAKGKLGFVNGDYSKIEKRVEFQAWRVNNSAKCSWLFNSIDDTIKPSVAAYKVARQMWNDLKERYSVVNGPRINQLKSELASLKQQGTSVLSYYTKLTSLWKELTGYEDVTCGCSCAAAPKLISRADIELTHQFLMGPDDSLFGTLRSQILSMDPLPTINKAYALVSQEERCKNIIRGREEREMINFTMQVVGGGGKERLDRPPYSYYGRNNHDYEHCYQRLWWPGSGRETGQQNNNSVRGDGCQQPQ
ncbi:hypothetical protein P3L10_023973 [Capsicum annuum]